MDISKLKTAVDTEYESVLEECFGNWISGVWFKFEQLDTIEENKEAFLILLKRLLDEGKVVFFAPHMMVHNKVETPTRSYREFEGIWDLPHEDIIEYIRANWPAGVTNENDIELTYYWYDGICPWIGWIHPETGELVAS